MSISEYLREKYLRHKKRKEEERDAYEKAFREARLKALKEQARKDARASVRGKSKGGFGKAIKRIGDWGEGVMDNYEAQYKRGRKKKLLDDFW